MANPLYLELKSGNLKKLKKSLKFKHALTMAEDIALEIKIMSVYLQIVERLKKERFAVSSLVEDEELLLKETDHNIRFLITYRIEQKKILESQVDLASYLLQVLNGTLNIWKAQKIK